MGFNIPDKHCPNHLPPYSLAMAFIRLVGPIMYVAPVSMREMHPPLQNCLLPTVILHHPFDVISYFKILFNNEIVFITTLNYPFNRIFHLASSTSGV